MEGSRCLCPAENSLAAGDLGLTSLTAIAQSYRLAACFPEKLGKAPAQREQHVACGDKALISAFAKRSRFEIGSKGQIPNAGAARGGQRRRGAGTSREQRRLRLCPRCSPRPREGHGTGGTACSSAPPPSAAFPGSCCSGTESSEEGSCNPSEVLLPIHAPRELCLSTKSLKPAPNHLISISATPLFAVTFPLTHSICSLPDNSLASLSARVFRLLSCHCAPAAAKPC